VPCRAVAPHGVRATHAPCCAAAVVVVVVVMSFPCVCLPAAARNTIIVCCVDKSARETASERHVGIKCLAAVWSNNICHCSATVAPPAKTAHSPVKKWRVIDGENYHDSYSSSR
jgi:hypothetical protein